MVNPCSSLEPLIFWDNPQQSTIDESKLMHQTWSHSRFQSRTAQAEITEIDRIISAWMHSINPMQKRGQHGCIATVLTAALQSSTSAQKSAQKSHSNESKQGSSSRDHWDRQNHHSLIAQHKSNAENKGKMASHSPDCSASKLHFTTEISTEIS